MKRKPLKVSPFMEKARQVIFSQRGLLMSVRRSAWFLFNHELARTDPATGKPYTPRKALANTLRWMDEQAEFLERIKQEPTQLERRILQMLINGKSGKQIAFEMGVHEKSVRWHFERMRSRLGAETTYQVVAIAVHSGWIRIGRPERRKTNKPV